MDLYIFFLSVTASEDSTFDNRFHIALLSNSIKLNNLNHSILCYNTFQDTNSLNISDALHLESIKKCADLFKLFHELALIKDDL